MNGNFGVKEPLSSVIVPPTRLETWSGSNRRQPARRGCGQLARQKHGSKTPKEDRGKRVPKPKDAVMARG